MITVDMSNVWGEITLPDLVGVEQEVSAAHALLSERTGPGADYLGWLDLPKAEPTAELERIQDNDPDFFFRMLPYAIAMGVDTRFAKLFGDEKLPHCSYFVTKDNRMRTAAEWALLLRKTADRMDALQRRMQLEKWLMVSSRRY